MNKLPPYLEELKELEKKATPGPWRGFTETLISDGYWTCSLPTTKRHYWGEQRDGSYKAPGVQIAQALCDSTLSGELRNALPRILADYEAMQSKIAKLEQDRDSMIEALEFYSKRKHIQISEEIDCSGIIYDYNELDWKVGPPYIAGVEYGQRAREALKKVRRGEE